MQLFVVVIWAAPRTGKTPFPMPLPPISAPPTGSRHPNLFANPAVTVARALTDTFSGIPAHGCSRFYRGANCRGLACCRGLSDGFILAIIEQARIADCLLNILMAIFKLLPDQPGVDRQRRDIARRHGQRASASQNSGLNTDPLRTPPMW